MFVNKKQIRQVLNLCVFNPKDAGFLKPLVETIQDNPDYALLRAKELIGEYQHFGKLNRLFVAMVTIAIYIANHKDFKDGTENGPIQPKT